MFSFLRRLFTTKNHNPRYVDTICMCGHWYEEHQGEDGCYLDGSFRNERCEPHQFVYSESYTLDALSERA